MLNRITFIFIFFLLCYAGLMARLFYWQVVKGQDLSVLAKLQYNGGQILRAPRGEILASDGSWLVATGESWLLFASIPDISDPPGKIADKLAPILVSEEEKELDKNSVFMESVRLTDLLFKEGAVWVPLKHDLTRDQKSSIEELKIAGLGFESEEKRVYPEASTAAQLMGFVGKDESGKDKGYFGLEGHYDFILSGKEGYFSREEDVRGVPILLDNIYETGPVEGIDLLTSIDKRVQLALDSKLKKGIEKYGAAAGTGIVMDPSNGAILAMSSYPSYDPASYVDYNDSLFTNPVVSSAFEPGSVFKIIVMASGLDAGVIQSDTKCPVCSGPYKIGKYSIKTWNGEYHPDSTMTDVIVNSDNVGMSYVGSQLGDELMYDYLSKFGIGKLTGVDLQGEGTSYLRKKGEWGEIDVATASFGQGVAVTPIQMIKAAAIIANKGVSFTPQVVDKVITDNWEDDIAPKEEGRVISEKSAKEITAMMVEAAKRGEAKWTNVPGFKVAGKTGTAQIPISGHYDEDRTIASFIGFAPYDDPKFIMLITLQEPQSSPWASETAAPLWYSVASDLFTYYGILRE